MSGLRRAAGDHVAKRNRAEVDDAMKPVRNTSVRRVRRLTLALTLMLVLVGCSTSNAAKSTPASSAPEIQQLLATPVSTVSDSVAITTPTIEPTATREPSPTATSTLPPSPTASPILVLTPSPTSTPVTPTPTPPLTSAPATAATYLAPTANVVVTASVSNATPAQNSSVTVSAKLVDNGQPIANAPMTTTWHYKTSTPTCTGTTGSDGIASCRRYIGGATKGYTVLVTVTLTWNGQTYMGQTAFKPQ